MEKEFIPYEQALSLKELGFDEECMSYYFNGKLMFGFKTSYGEVINAPLYQQAFRWFRENKKLISTLTHSYGNIWSYEIIEFYTQESIAGVIEGIWFNSYEEAELELLKKLIEIVNK